MNLEELYRKAIKIGIDNDPRGPKAAEEDLDKMKKEFKELSDAEKKYFDSELLVNPYPDSRISVGTNEQTFKSVLVGIDIFGPEILIGKEMNVDLLISHHPEGKGESYMYRVLWMQAGIFKKHGARLDSISQQSREDSILRQLEHFAREIREYDTAENTDQVPSIARFYKLPLINFHTIADNCITTYLEKTMERRAPDTLNDIMTILYEIPEYQIAASKGNGPWILAGRPTNKSGKILIDMTGGYEAPSKIIMKLSRAGVGTLVSMHISKDLYEMAERCDINVINAGHYSSDSLGMNLLLDEILPADTIINEISGFTRVDRRK